MPVLNSQDGAHLLPPHALYSLKTFFFPSKTTTHHIPGLTKSHCFYRLDGHWSNARLVITHSQRRNHLSLFIQGPLANPTYSSLVSYPVTSGKKVLEELPEAENGRARTMDHRSYAKTKLETQG